MTTPKDPQRPQTPTELAEACRKLADDAWEMTMKEVAQILHNLARDLEETAKEIEPHE